MTNMRARVFPYAGEGNTKAFVNLEIDIPCLEGVFIVKGIAIKHGKNGDFVSWPSHKAKKDGQYHDDVYPTTKADRENINNMIMDGYKQAMWVDTAKAVSKFRD